MTDTASPELNGQTRLFLSYAHVDNNTAHRDHRGWVSQFDLSLANELKQRGILDIDLWRDKRDIPDHKRFDPEILDGLRSAALMLSVLSPVYIQREYCLKELHHFAGIAGHHKIFKVVKRWRDHLDEHEPHPLRGRVGYHFYEIDPESEHEVPYYNPGGGEPRPEYWDIIGRLADDIEAALRQSTAAELDETPSTFVEATVFLAAATRDLAEWHWRLANELKRHRIRVVPDPRTPLPTAAADVERVIAEALHGADIAVHLLGNTSGFTPEDAPAPIVLWQLDASGTKSTENQRFHRLIWVAPDPRERNAEQQALINAFRSGDRLLPNDELVEERFEQLKALLIDRVQRLRSYEIGAGTQIGARVYVMCDAPDIDLAEKVADILANAGCDVTTPVVEGTPASRTEFDFYTLRTSHAVLIVFSDASEIWVRKTLDRLEDWSSYERKGPFQARAVLLGPPETRSKRRFRPRNADLVIRAIDTISRDRLMPFLQRLGEALAMVAASAANPFPGLRPFDFDDRDFFFGREDQIRELRRKLKSNHFIAVVGTSGCGKSSLVRAGLFKYLDLESGWRWTTMRPQGQPLRQLALALLDLKGRPEAIPLDIQLSRTETALRRSSSGIVDLLVEGRPLGGPVLLVVDQFEELFRFERPEDLLGYLDEAQAFVWLLLRAVRSSDLPLHVILTMRSDFLGDCARFPDLPESINDSQFLVPRLTRDQRRQAIVRPIEKVGASIQPALLQRLLNDVGDDPDQLPVLQHVLMRTWQVAAREWAKRPAIAGLAEASAHFEAPPGDDGQVLSLAHYEHEDVGGMERALSRHADAVLKQLKGHQSTLAAKQVFKALADLDPEGRAVRRTPPPRLDDLIAIVGDADRAREVVEAFRATDCGFLVPSFDDLPQIEGDRRVDIAHEALIRRWTEISGTDGTKGWLSEEAADGRIYRHLLDFIDEFGAQRGLGADEAAKRVPWWSPVLRNAAWAERYGGRFDEAAALIDRSKVELRWARRRRVAIFLLPLVAAAALGAATMWMQERDLRRQLEMQAHLLESQDRRLKQRIWSLSDRSRPPTQPGKKPSRQG